MIQALILAMFLLDAPVDAESPEATLPPPYTTDQIRDTWREGFSLTVRTRDSGGERFNLRTVVDWTPEAVTIHVAPVNALGLVIGDAKEVTVKWEDLQKHAVFPAARATRERASRDTPIGRLDGWLYRVRNDGSTSEFFFGDTTPGMPVHYGEMRDGKWVSESEQVSRTEAPSSRGAAAGTASTRD